MSLKRDEWEELVGRWRVSRQSARQFAAAHGVTDTALRYWANRLAAEEGADEVPVARPTSPARRTTSTLAIARVVRRGEIPAADGAGRVIVMVGQAAIAVEPGFDGAHLRAVVHALSEVG